MKVLSNLICIIFFLNLLLCDDVSVNFEEFARKLDYIDSEIKAQIENKLQMTIIDLQFALASGDTKVQKRVICLLNPFLLNMFIRAVNEKCEIETFANEKLVPQLVPNNFLCAFTITNELLLKVQKSYVQQGSRSQSTNFTAMLFELTGSYCYTVKRQLKDEEFKLILERKGTNLDSTIIENFCKYTIDPYRFHNQWNFYQNSVVKSFLEWQVFLKTINCRLKNKIIHEMRVKFGSDLAHHEDGFCLSLARLHFIGKDVKHRFWVHYQHVIGGTDQHEFDTILENFYDPGWFFTVDDIDYFNVLVHAYNGVYETKIPEIWYETLLNESSTMVLPQSSVCRATKRNLSYLLRHWRVHKSSSNWTENLSLC